MSYLFCWKEGSIKENQLNTPLIVLLWMAFDWIDDICIEADCTALCILSKSFIHLLKLKEKYFYTQVICNQYLMKGKTLKIVALEILTNVHIRIITIRNKMLVSESFVRFETESSGKILSNFRSIK